MLAMTALSAASLRARVATLLLALSTSKNKRFLIWSATALRCVRTGRRARPADAAERR